MSRHLTKEEEERLWRLAQEWDRLYLSLRNASLAEKIQAFKQLEKRFLKEMRTASGKRQVQRRITNSLLMETRVGPWRRFSPYLRRMERIGYASMDDRLLVCCWAAQAAQGSPAGLSKAVALLIDFERRARIRPPAPEAREQVEFMVARARKFAGLGATEDVSEGAQRSKKPKARGRRSVE
ncbi:hypothetical protein [Vitiosangium sp. GDMCC 1.1324]|uniref:hypothetical protein n=1 Tax=Vitiosangium sp. (strain GDMCC 1.1324) TaxID=2138576 RepID=UPI000D34DA2C|nr:hypothetical protein [Vitiosangium sp. GDMCC 1.1324]PTL85446.1 hypothetical protein DAT35_01630 [Vitiosangium sp. GDMCC 1.1324]